MLTAIYVRVSTDKQEASNQLLELRIYASKCQDEIFHEYIDIISGKEDRRPDYDKLFLDAHQRKFEKVLFWDLTRFSRSGTLFTLQKLKELENLSIIWESYKEQYFRSAGPFKDVVISIISTLAKIEREKISDRTKAGLARVKKSGKSLGRPKGSKDKKKRKKSGYYKRYENNISNKGVSNKIRKSI